MDRSPATTGAPTGGAPRTDEECPRCLRAYVLEMEFRCVVCDSPLCPGCVVLVTADEHERAFCRRCRPAA